MNSDLNDYLTRYLVTALKMSPNSTQHVDITGLTFGFEIEVAVDPSNISGSIEQLTETFNEIYTVPDENDFFERIGLKHYINKYTTGPTYGWANKEETQVWDEEDPNEDEDDPDKQVHDHRVPVQLSDIEDLDQARELFDEYRIRFNNASEAWIESEYNDALEQYMDSYGNKEQSPIDFVFNEFKDYFPEYKVGLGASYNRWSIVSDSSIRHSNEEDDDKETGAEIVSPIFNNVDAGIEALKNVFKFIKDKHLELETNESTGLHINIGTFKDGKLNGKPVDLLKLFLFLGETYVLNQFDRVDNSYTQPVIHDLVKFLNEAKAQTSGYADIIAKINASILANPEKYRTCNISHFSSPNKGRLEFRIMGNTDYHKREAEVVATINRFIKAINLATNPHNGKQEYLKKLALIGTTIDKMKTEYNVDSLAFVNKNILTQKEWNAVQTAFWSIPDKYKSRELPNITAMQYDKGDIRKASSTLIELIISIERYNKSVSNVAILALVKLRHELGVTRKMLKANYQKMVSDIPLFNNKHYDYDTYVMNLPSSLKPLFK